MKHSLQISFLITLSILLFNQVIINGQAIRKSFKYLICFIFIQLCVLPSFSQGTWTQKANFAGGVRYGTACFSIGNKIYVGTGGTTSGTNVTRDFWQWDPCTNVWTQLDSFPGVARAYGVGFSIGNKGYIGLGCAVSGNVTPSSPYYNDFYRYDPVANTWTPIANFGGAGRQGAGACSVGGKGYVGAGDSNGSFLNDFWEFDTTSGAWTKKTNFGGVTRNDPVAFAIGNHVYMGTGYNGSKLNDFWEYDPATDAWTQKNNFAGAGRNVATGFTIGNYGYIVGGYNWNAQYDCWKYDPAADTWLQETSYAGSGIGKPIGVSTGCKGYVGAGFTGSTLYQDFYEFYDSSNSAMCTAGSVTPVNAGPDISVCSGQSTTLNATGGNPSNYLWSPAAGLSNASVANPIANPTVTTQYVLSSVGGCSSGTVTDTVTITVVPSVVLNPVKDTTVCAGQTVALNPTGLVSYQYQWSPANGLSCGTCSNPGASPADSTVYTVIAGNGTCSDTAHAVINVRGATSAGVVSALRDTICQGTRGSLMLSGNSSNTIQWQSSTTQEDFINTGTTDTTSYKTEPLMQSTYYRVIVGSGACIDSSNVLQLYVPPALTASFTYTISGKQVTFTSTSQGNINSYYWDFGDGQIGSGVNPAHTFTADTVYNVCLTIYDGSNCSYTFCRDVNLKSNGVMAVEGNDKWNIYPVPFNDYLVIKGNNTSNRVEAIEITDELGRVVFYKNIIENITSPVVIEASGMARGMYFLQIKTDNIINVQKIIKQ